MINRVNPRYNQHLDQY